MQTTPSLRLLLLTLALVLFAVSAYLAANLGERLVRLAFVALALALLF